MPYCPPFRSSDIEGCWAVVNGVICMIILFDSARLMYTCVWGSPSIVLRHNLLCPGLIWMIQMNSLSYAQFWWQGIKKPGASYSETFILLSELLMGPDDWIEEHDNTFLDVCASENVSHNSLASQHLERVVPVCAAYRHTWWCTSLVSSQGNWEKVTLAAASKWGAYNNSNLRLNVPLIIEKYFYTCVFVWMFWLWHTFWK